MPRVKQSQLARSRGGNEMLQSVAARMTRNKMRADWDTVHRMLTDPKAPQPRRSGTGRFRGLGRYGPRESGGRVCARCTRHSAGRNAR